MKKTRPEIHVETKVCGGEPWRINIWRRIGLCSACLFVAASLAAQEFTLDWFAVAAGGGESSGGDFELSATIGQPDAGNFAGGDFDVVGGFWSIVTVLGTPGTPSLFANVSAGQLIISWPENGSASFALEETSALATPSGNTTWTAVNVTASSSNGVKSVQLPLAAGNHFYRLRKP